jgi:(5-formylfuran-3-yl)methyl phosphate synthase
VARLLVSVRSPVEALAAVAGGASIIDVKEPPRGALGRASPSVWRSVRDVVPASISVSVALGELSEWIHFGGEPIIPPDAWRGIAFCKVGLSGAPIDWIGRWARLLRQCEEMTQPSSAPVAVVYTDWEAARAPHPDSVIQAAVEMPGCRVILFDTWSKASGTPLNLTWKSRIDRAKNSGLSVALAGSLDVESIKRLAVLGPDIFAVRGSACTGGDRLGSIDSERVARLVAAAGSLTPQTAHLEPAAVLAQS